jgi:hypothetical protein
VPLLRFRPARSYDVEKLREVLLGVAGDRPDSAKRGWG